MKLQFIGAAYRITIELFEAMPLIQPYRFGSSAKMKKLRDVIETGISRRIASQSVQSHPTS